MKNYNTSQMSKYPKIDCTDDALMVRENLRVPALRGLDIQHPSLAEIKKAKLDYKNRKTSKYSEAQNELVKAFAENINKVKFNLVKIQII